MVTAIVTNPFPVPVPTPAPVAVNVVPTVGCPVIIVSDTDCEVSTVYIPIPPGLV